MHGMMQTVVISSGNVGEQWVVAVAGHWGRGAEHWRAWRSSLESMAPSRGSCPWRSFQPRADRVDVPWLQWTAWRLL